ncbi:HAMP domain-containing sensor histidine kinase [Emticicia sp. BO119]|uniref:sensor histidine kinase n=1 Tax=Emticicia sp. BO119 TaxID=2757768 RepID=UPI0015EFF1ED|nr:HAMP domain-containing sensor histidine kinase [Emticicia sp. BO119]MBA4853428.1 HAMP domain-containing histidine kinase [Emticicia sp. BO119]
MSKLLNKPLRAFTLYALIILILSIPAYYWVVDTIWLNELDVHNKTVEGHIKDGFKKNNLSSNQITEAINVWSQIQPGVKIRQVQPFEVKKDSVYEVIRPNKYANEVGERFRGRSTYFYIQGKPYHLLVETNVEETHETVIAIAVVTILFFSLLVIGFILLNRKISTQIWRPFKNTLNQLKSFDLNSQKPIKLAVSDIEEFEELNQVLTKLIDNNIAVYNQQKQFTENASHELQTPLALLKSKIDLLLQDKNLNKKQLELITTLNTPLARVSRINKNLLLLAKIENHQYSDEQIIHLNKVLNENIEILSDYAANKQVSIENLIKETIMINGNKHLLEIMLTNLLVNAIKHNIENGMIGINYQAPVFSIYNSATNSLNKDTLFKRFISASSQSPNNGLGLSIVKEICNRYNWTINYTFTNNQHHFSITFQ